jgi:hypothetical protein
MAIRFRRSVKIAPGLKLNVGKRGGSVRIGGKNAGYTIGTSGRTVSASVPGTGLGFVSRKGRSPKGREVEEAAAPSGGSGLVRLALWIGAVLVVLWLLGALLGRG